MGKQAQRGTGRGGRWRGGTGRIDPRVEWGRAACSHGHHDRDYSGVEQGTTARDGGAAGQESGGGRTAPGQWQGHFSCRGVRGEGGQDFLQGWWKITLESLGVLVGPYLLHVCDHRNQTSSLTSGLIKPVLASSGFDSSLRTPKS